MDTRLLHQFDKEFAVEYRGETYRVRDNGSVCRQRRPNQRRHLVTHKPDVPLAEIGILLASLYIIIHHRRQQGWVGRS